jgi:hypothetical protein
MISMKPENDLTQNTITEILVTIEELLREHYAAASRLPDDKDRIKIGFAVVIQYHEVETTCTYGRRYKATAERHIDDPDQIKLNLVPGNGAA